MQEAFRRALEEVSETGEQLSLDERTLAVLESATSDQPQQRFADTELARLGYAARTLGRRWGTHTNTSGKDSNTRNRLCDEWAMLSAALAKMPSSQRLQVLMELAGGMGIGDARADQRKVRFLHQRMQARPELFEGFDLVEGFGKPSIDGFILHSVAELSSCTVEERRRLHAFVAERHTPALRRFPWWLLLVLAQWIGVRYELDQEL